MKIHRIIESELDDLKAMLAKVKDEVDVDRAGKQEEFSEIEYTFGDNFKKFDTMLNILLDKATKKPQKSRDSDIDDFDTPTSKKMKEHGLLTSRGGITPLAYDYLTWVASTNMRPPSPDQYPKRYTQDTIDRAAKAEKMGNFPPTVVSALRQFDNKKTIQGREDGMRMQPNVGAARKAMLNKIRNMLPKLQARVRDRERPR